MIVTVTPNPSIDVALTVDSLVVGEVNRATAVQRDPAGKGINVARALAANGHPATAVFPSDPVAGAQLETLLAATSVSADPVAISRPIRQNVTIQGSNGTTKINEAGPAIDDRERERFTAAIVARLDAAPDWLVVAGSLPPGIPDSWIVEIGRAARERSVSFAADVSGSALGAITASGVASIVKPNDEELTELVGAQLRTVDDVVRAARSVLGQPDAQALVSLGKNGALLVTRDSFWWAGVTPKIAVSTVGAGDATLAGYLSAEGKTPAARLVAGVAWGSAAVSLPGTESPTAASIDYDAVKLVAAPAGDILIEELAL